MMLAATGLAVGRGVDEKLASMAVMQAMQKMEATSAGAVLLFLTSEFASDPLPAIRAAAKASSSMQIIGCSAPGIFTDEDWVLDAPAAAAMVFDHAAGFGSVSAPLQAQVLLALTAPNALNSGWINAPGLRFGGVSGDVTGQGPFSVWQNAKGMAQGYCEASFSGVDAAIAPAHDIKLLGVPMRVTAAEGYDLQSMENMPALAVLHASVNNEEPPLHLLMAVIADHLDVILQGRYQLTTLVSGNEDSQSVTLARQVEAGQYVAWAIRDTEAAQQNLSSTAEHLVQKLGAEPDFGMLFSCLGRGPYFYDGVDRDLRLLKQRFPEMPLIGFYGNGEIAPINGENVLLQYSAALGLFAANAGAQHGLV